MSRKMLISFLLSGGALILSGSLLVQGLVLEKQPGEEVQIQAGGQVQGDIGAEGGWSPAEVQVQDDIGVEEAKAERTATTIDEAFLSTMQPDTSQGSYRSGKIVESSGRIFAADNKGQRLISLNLDGTRKTETEVASYHEEGSEALYPESIMVTEQYLYLCSAYAVLQFTREGQFVGIVAQKGVQDTFSINLKDALLWYEDGYIYIEETYGRDLYRVKAEPGSRAEKVKWSSEDSVIRNDYAVYNGYIYYFDRGLKRIHEDGSGTPETVSSEITANCMSGGKFFEDGFYFHEGGEYAGEQPYGDQTIRIDLDDFTVGVVDTDHRIKSGFYIVGGQLVHEYMEEGQDGKIRGIGLLNPMDGTDRLFLEVGKYEKSQTLVEVPGATQIYYSWDETVGNYEDSLYVLNPENGNIVSLGEEIPLWR